MTITILHILFISCGYVVCIDAYWFTLPSRLLNSKIRRNAISQGSAAEDLREHQRKLYKSALECESYEYEYDGKIMTYTPDANALTSSPLVINDTQTIDTTMLTRYVADEGLESVITSRGVTKPLLQLEYEIAFKLFPRLRRAALERIWPDPLNVTYDTAKAINESAFITTPEMNREVHAIAVPALWCKHEGNLNDARVTRYGSMGNLLQLCDALREVTDSRNATLCMATLSELGIDVTHFIFSMPQNLDMADPTMSAPNRCNYDLFALGMQSLHNLFEQTLNSPVATHHQKLRQYRTQDALLRIFRMALVVIKANLLSGQIVTFSYADLTTRATEGVIFTE